MKIEDYARADDGRIFKITKLDLDLCNNNCKINCKKSSSNIIDLIEKGDYVNGYKVDIISDSGLICNIYNLDDSAITIKAENIKSIVTHEQFEERSYKL